MPRPAKFPTFATRVNPKTDIVITETTIRPCPAVRIVNGAQFILSYAPRVTKRSFKVLTVFLPAAGNRNGTDVYDVGSNGNYWSSSANDENNAYNLYFNSGNVNPDNANNRKNGYSVRLVRAL